MVTVPRYSLCETVCNAWSQHLRHEQFNLARASGVRWNKDELLPVHSTLDVIPQMIWMTSADRSQEYYNSKWRDFTGVDLSASGTGRRLDLVHPSDQSRASSAWERSFATSSSYECSYRLLHKSGEYRWILSRGEPARNREGAVSCWYGTCTDIHETVLAKQALAIEEVRSRSIIDSSPDCISFLDRHGNIEFLNPAAEKALSPAFADGLTGTSWTSAFHPNSRRLAQQALMEAQDGRVGRFVTSQKVGDNVKWWDVLVTPVAPCETADPAFLGVARDITHQKFAEEQAQWSANHDPLTGLSNRAMFQRSLDHLLACAKGRDSSFSVLIFDLDHLKQANDALGHDAGDALLRSFAERVRGILGSNNLFARLGGDEFAAILKNACNPADLQTVAASIFDKLREPCVHEGKLLDLRTSIGASSFPQHGTTSAEILKNADVALYAAKAAGRGILKVFEAPMRAAIQKRVSMLSLARDALDNGRVLPFYQPKLDLRERKINGFEVLLRWRDVRGGIHGPSLIHAAFEDDNLARQISDRILDAVMVDMARWVNDRVEFGHVAVNASAADFRRGDFAERVLRRLERSGLPPEFLQVEVTETVFLGRGADYVRACLKTLAAAGVKIALDDFGTGYASLSHLKEFPVSVLKIDRTFIRNIHINNEDATIVRAIIRLAANLGLQVIAEGIETSSQLKLLRKWRCDMGQGYFFGHAAPASEAVKSIGIWSRLPKSTVRRSRALGSEQALGA